VFLLVTGSSGAGKSTARRLISDQLSPGVECIELGHVAVMPRFPTKAWRQRATEAAVRRAVALQAEGRHLLLSGDPVAAGEVIAAPSAARLDAIAVCLLDVDREVQAARLGARGDDPALFGDHEAFADWMRGHALDPRHMPHVLTLEGWEEMRWERWIDRAPGEGSWSMHVVVTSRMTRDQVADHVLAWCRRALAGRAPVIEARESGHPSASANAGQ
jgi:hypothetical protein